MKRLTTFHFEPLISEAPALVISFNRDRKSRIVQREQLAEVTEGIITLSPLAIFFLECQFVWEAFVLRAAFRGRRAS